MPQAESAMLRMARWFAFASAISILFSIALCAIFQALALAAALFSEAKFRAPPRIWAPLSLFICGTLLSLALSDNPAAGLPQVRRIYVYLQLVLVFSLLGNLASIRQIFYCWFGIGALSALKGIVQFYNKAQQAHSLGRPFYEYYVSERITGFMSHWMTFGGQGMFVLLLLIAWLLFGSDERRRYLPLALLAGALVGLGILLGFTRTIWLGTAVGAFYLLWAWKRWYALLLPAALLILMFSAPSAVRERAQSALRPKKGVDSNEFRKVCWIAGWEMIKAHPWFGLGPERVKARFEEFVPPDVPRPLPEGWYGHLHNIYIHFAAERGIPTMLMLMWLLLQALHDFARRAWALPPGRGDVKFVLHGAVAVLLATMTAGVFEHNLGDSEVLTMFLIVLACGYAAAGLREADVARA